jgi:cyclopropane fatty-acyl-phospholipid synthase-like methyltransferase
MYSFTDQFLSNEKNARFQSVTMMGPNAMRMSEEMASYLSLKPEMRVLDLGCGCGLSSLFLVQKYNVNVFAADLWIHPTDNFERFKSFGIEDRAVPISIDATKGLPFAYEYFDILFSVDAYHYFGDTSEMLPSLIPFVKKGGYIAIAIPGLKYEFGEKVPDAMKPYWENPEIARTIRSLDWWRDLWQTTDGIEIESIREMACCKQAWDEWLVCPSPYAKEDIEMMEAESGKYFNLIQLIARVA